MDGSIRLVLGDLTSCDLELGSPSLFRLGGVSAGVRARLRL